MKASTQSAAGFRDALSEGVIYPRWIDSASHGLGSLTFIYYPPLPYYAAALTSFVTDDLVAAFEVVLLMATALSGWGLYALVASFASRSAAAAAAQAYFLAPYRAIDLYDRFAFAEFVAFIWPPLVVLGLRRILVDDRRRGDLARSALLANLRKPGLARDD